MVKSRGITNRGVGLYIREEMERGELCLLEQASGSVEKCGIMTV